MFIFFTIFSFSPAFASIFTCNSTGSEKTTFYTNETVYITSSTNITSEATTIKFYIATHRTWSIGTSLPSVAKVSRSIATNSSGHLPVSLIWSPVLTVGTYDLIADLNGNATFDSEDLLYNASGDGFTVVEEPKPKLTVSKGTNSPGDHDWYEVNGSKQNEMLQVKLEAGSYDGIKINSFYISAFGSGDDKNDVSYVAVCVDSDEDGKCGFGEEILGFGQYSRDNGIAEIDLKDGLSLEINSSLSLVFYYVLKPGIGSPEGKTFGFQLAMLQAFGSATGTRATVIGLPLSSATKTVYSQATTTTTTTSTTITTLPTTTTTTVPEEEEERINLFLGIAVAIFAAFAIITIFYFFFLRHPPQAYAYKPQ